MLLVLTVIVWTPALLLGLGLALARLTGCPVDEGSRHPCRICGLDIGGLLYTLTMMGWLMIPMLPFMLLTAGLAVGTGIWALVQGWWA
ncbi:hypothetical protein [Methylobacterium sp. Leaf118]|uniref:hypothetical protein n=1 Tax=Methylobacterium sp. Leaf118 TaxID=2876562 RepID=UPI001E5E0EAA|nr:hypothetical protein [Methylobacterium sp. Leaf118]